MIDLQAQTSSSFSPLTIHIGGLPSYPHRLTIDGSTGMGLDLAPASVEDGRGLVVLKVDPTGVAGVAGVVKVGDVLLTVNGTNVLVLPAASAIQVLAVAATTGSVTLQLRHTPSFIFRV